MRIVGGPHRVRECHRRTGAEVEVGAIEHSGVEGSKEVDSLQVLRVAGVEADHRLTEAGGWAVACDRAGRRGGSVARGQQDGVGPVRDEPAAGLPDAAACVSAVDIGPEAARSAAGRDPGHEALIGAVIAMRGEGGEHVVVEQQEPRSLQLQVRIEGCLGIVGGAACDLDREVRHLGPRRGVDGVHPVAERPVVLLLHRDEIGDPCARIHRRRRGDTHVRGEVGATPVDIREGLAQLPGPALCTRHGIKPVDPVLLGRHHQGA